LKCDMSVNCIVCSFILAYASLTTAVGG